MLRRPCQYRNISDRIFTDLMRGKLLESAQVQSYLKQHVNTAVSELIEAERELDLNGLNTSQITSSVQAGQKNRHDELEIQGQIRYLVNHIGGLARGTKIQSDIVLYDHVLQTLKSAVMRNSGKQLSDLFLNLCEGAETIPGSKLSLHDVQPISRHSAVQNTIT